MIYATSKPARPPAAQHSWSTQSGRCLDLLRKKLCKCGLSPPSCDPHFFSASPRKPYSGSHLRKRTHALTDLGRGVLPFRQEHSRGQSLQKFYATGNREPYCATGFLAHRHQRKSGSLNGRSAL